MSRRKVLFTCVLALSGLVVAYDGLQRFKQAEHWSGVALPALMVICAYIVFAAWVGWNIVQMLGERIGRLYWPKETVVPPPLYFLTESYERQGRISEALQEYQKILKYHPSELQAHIGQLRCQSLLGMPPLKLWRIYGHSFRLLGSDREKELLTREYEKLSATAAHSARAKNSRP